MKKSFFIALVFVICSSSLYSQILNPVKWVFSFEKQGDVVSVTATATIDESWKIYGTDLAEGGPNKTDFGLDVDSGSVLIGKPVEVLPSTHAYDKVFDMQISFWHDKAVVKQDYKITDPHLKTLNGYVEYQACDNQQCLPPTQVSFVYDLNKGAQEGKANVPTAAAGALPIWYTNPVETHVEYASSDHDTRNKGLWMTFLLAFLGGLAALLTPCVFPMIPFTVSYFTKQSKTRSKGIKNALIYGISIIIIYVLLGTGIVAIFGADSLNALSTNPTFNVVFFLILLVFAASFFGAFEITLPSSWVNASDKGVDKGGFVGIFFMAFTLALVSFSCTGPIVGTLLVAAASSGSWIAPAVGMFGFSLALAIPFALFAAFPGWLNSLPKSGGWMNSVKVVLAFVELAMALKFLSIADMVLDLHLFHREPFIALWTAIALLMGLYLLGLLRLPHDSPKTKPKPLAAVLGFLSIVFAAYLSMGLWSSRVTLISGFPPPSDYAESPFGLAANQVTLSILAILVVGVILLGLLFATLVLLKFVRSKRSNSTIISVPKIFGSIVTLSLLFYLMPIFSGAPVKLLAWAIPGFEVTSNTNAALPAGMHYGPQGIPCFDNYEQALSYAKQVNKPVFLDFTGVGCVNCRKVEDNVWSHQEIKNILSRDYVMVSLYVDVKEELPKSEQYVSPTTGNKIKTVGNKWSDFQATRFKANSQPFYVVVTSDRKAMGTVKTMDLDVERYKAWLLSNLAIYKKNK